MKTEMLVIGADHSNTLGMIRALGKEKYTVNLIIHSHTIACDNDMLTMCEKSKFANGFLSVIPQEENTLIHLLLTLASNKNGIQMIVFPTSDYAALCIDRNYNILREQYVLPSIDGKQGGIARYMDKAVQKELADHFGIRMAKTLRISLEQDTSLHLPNAWKYPVVLKPIISAEGSKTDIVFASKDEELHASYRNLLNRGYKEILLQEFIEKDYELCAFGCITKRDMKAHYTVLKKLREYPFEGGGSTSFAVMDDNRMATTAVELLKEIHYYGMFDIDLFVVGEQVFLNEINFRNSGNTWAGVQSGINAPAIWAKDFEGKTHINAERKKTLYYMDETADIHYALLKRIGVLHWLGDFFRTRAFNKFWIRDLRGTFAFYGRSLRWHTNNKRRHR